MSLLRLLPLILVTTAQTAALADADYNIIASLTRQIAILDEVKPTVDRIDLGRLQLIKTSAQAVLDKINANVAAGHVQVNSQVQKLLNDLDIQYTFSKVFLGWTTPVSPNSIITQATTADLTELKGLVSELEAQYDMDGVATEIKSMFAQMYQHLQTLDGFPITDGLKGELKTLWQPIGDTLAVADRGDQDQQTRNNAIAVIKAMRVLYPELNQVSESAAAFQTVIELQGLTEFCASYLGIDEAGK